MSGVIMDDLVWSQKLRDEERNKNKCKFCGRETEDDNEPVCLVCEDCQHDVEIDRLAEKEEELR